MTTQHAKSNAREGDGVADFAPCCDSADVLVYRTDAPHQLRGQLYLACCRWCGKGVPFVSVGPHGENATQQAIAAWNAAMQAQQGAEPANPPGDQRQEGWYCAHCQRTVPPVEVTYAERHESCGSIVSASPPPEAECKHRRRVDQVCDPCARYPNPPPRGRSGGHCEDGGLRSRRRSRLAGGHDRPVGG